LPLATDTLISIAAARRAAEALDASGIAALLAPSVDYGVTDFAQGFAGAISIPSAVLTSFLRAVAEGYLRAGFSHVCLVNNHLEPAHDMAVRAAVADFAAGRASVACPLTRRWGRTLGDEFKSGACHAGQYETSLVLAAEPDLVREDLASSLPAIDVSLSEGIKRGMQSFRAMGIERAYTGAPSAATAAEGDELLNRLSAMIVATVTEGFAAARGAKEGP
jgi:creatinine amidohydrolase